MTMVKHSVIQSLFFVVMVGAPPTVHALLTPGEKAMAQHLVDVGREFYEVARYDEARHEFEKALLLDPYQTAALSYLHLMGKRGQLMEDEVQREAALARALRAGEMDVAIRDAAASTPQGSATPPTTIAGAGGPFVTYEVPKTSEELQAEEADRRLLERVTHTLEQPEESTEIPYAARPAIDLQGTVSYSYNDSHAAAPQRDLRTRVTGRAYDFNVEFETDRQDMSGRFDHNYTYLNLMKPNFFLGFFDQTTNLYPLRTQYDSFNGIKLIQGWDLGGHHATTIAGGDIENSVSGTSGVVKYLGHLYEVREEFKPSEWLKLRSGMYYLENDADLPERTGASDYPRTDLISFSGVELTLPQRIVVSADAAYSAYQADNAPDSDVRDWNWRTGIDWNQEHYRLRYDYEYVGDRYASLGDPATYRDFQGWNLSGSYRLTDWWSVGSGIRRYRDNVDKDSTLPTTRNQALSASSSFRLPHDRSLNVTWNNFLSDPFGPSVGSSSRLNQYRLDYVQPFVLDTRFLGSYQYARTTVPAGSDTIAHTISASLFGSLGRGSIWRVREDIVHTARELEADSLTLNTTLDVDYLLWPGFSVFSNAQYGRDLTDELENTDTIALGTGVRYQIDSDTTLRVEYRINSYNLDTEHGRWPKGWSILFYISQFFGISTEPNFGKVEAHLFHDMNDNGRHEANEPWVEGARILLEDKATRTTDAQGYVFFPRVVPGAATLRVDLADCDPTLTMREPRRTLVVKGHRTIKLTLPVLTGASVQGRVFIDANANATFEETEEPLENVAMVLSPGETFTRTDEDGMFRFGSLLPGSYTVTIHTDDIPSGYEVVGSQTLPLELKPGEQLEGVNVSVRLIPPGTKGAEGAALE